MRISPAPALLVALTLIATIPNAIAAPKPIALKPISKWLVDWAPESCVLARKFGTEKQPVLLSLRSYAPGYAFQMLVAGKPATLFNDRTDLTVSYGAGSPISISGAQGGRADGFGDAMIASSVLDTKDRRDANPISYLSARPFPDTAFENQLDRITFATRGRQVTFETGPMAPALDALRTCTDDLAKELGLDPERQHGLIREASDANTDEWVPRIQALFPMALSIQGKGARVILRVVVDTEGTPTRCDSFQSFNNTDFKVKACDIILRRARFHPALDAHGIPVASIYSNVIIYKWG